MREKLPASPRRKLLPARCLVWPVMLLCGSLAQAGDINAVLDRMEPGSVIKDLLIPRYDENKKASLILRADRMVVESLKQMTAEKLSLHLISSKSNRALNASWFSIESCTYDVNTGLLRSDSAVNAVSANFLLHSQGLITRIEPDQTGHTAFLLPPVHGFLNPNSDETTAMNRTRQSLLLASILTAQAAAQDPAATPAAAVDGFFAVTPRSQEIDAQLQEFAKKNGVKIDPVALPEQPPAVLQPVEPAAAIPQFKPAADAIGFACKGGVFYDSKTASLTMLKDITVRNPSYAMTVKGEVKMLFEPEVEKKKPAPSEKKELPEKELPEPKKEPKKEEEKSPTNSLGKVKQMLGTGGVAFEATDKDGVKNFASGDSVIYEVSSEEILLKGNKLIFQQGVQSRFESAAPDAWLRFNLKTKNFTMSDGWNARLAMPNNVENKAGLPEKKNP